MLSDFSRKDFQKTVHGYSTFASLFYSLLFSTPFNLSLPSSKGHPKNLEHISSLISFLAPLTTGFPFKHYPWSSKSSTRLNLVLPPIVLSSFYLIFPSSSILVPPDCPSISTLVMLSFFLLLLTRFYFQP